jgi:hypothetical protein
MCASAAIPMIVTMAIWLRETHGAEGAHGLVGPGDHTLIGNVSP